MTIYEQAARDFESEPEDDFDDETGDDEEGVCPSCNGSGEGGFDGTTCSTCGGSGTDSCDDDGDDFEDGYDEDCTPSMIFIRGDR